MRETRQQRRARERRDRKEKPSLTQGISVSRSVPKRIGQLISAILTLIGLVVGLGVGFVALYPWLSVETGERLRPHDPFGIILNASNEGYLPLRNVEVSCSFSGSDANHNTYSDNKAIFHHVADSLSYKNKLSLPCFRAFVLGVPLTSAKSEVVLTYNVWVFPGRRSQSFSLDGQPDTDGNWHWLFKN